MPDRDAGRDDPSPSPRKRAERIDDHGPGAARRRVEVDSVRHERLLAPRIVR